MTLTVISTMPPRQRHVRIQGWPTRLTDTVAPVHAFAVWSDGQVTPIVEQADQLGAFPARGMFGNDARSWALTDAPDLEAELEQAHAAYAERQATP
jgi:hypothetical protein